MSFYDKIAKKFGDYHSDARYVSDYPNKDPEKVFKEKLLELSNKNAVALDLGCADGRFTLSVAPYFQKIVAIDLSRGMLKAAKKFQNQKK
ncbi:MAG: class I SAM-dependent methyltransferase [Patescibacteria group bacterium]